MKSTEILNGRQRKDFERVAENIYFEEENIFINDFGHIIIKLTNYSQNAIEEVKQFIKNLNNKNILFIEKRNAIIVA